MLDLRTTARSVRGAAPLLALALGAGSATAQDVWRIGFDGIQPPSQAYVERTLASLPPAPEFGLGPRWPGAPGSPAVVTWSFCADGVSIPSLIGENAANSNLFSRLDNVFATQGGRAAWVQRFQMCFDRWEELTGLDFQRITVAGQDWDDGASWGAAGSATRGDIRIAMKKIDLAGGVASIAAFPGNGDMVLDRAETWDDPADLHRYLRNTVTWSLGIANGLDLACPTDGTKLLETIIPLTFDGPRQDDIRGMQSHYGDPSEIDDGPGSATSLGALSIGVPVAVGALPPPPTGTSDPSAALLSIDADGESDWYSFSIAGPAVGHALLTPIGSTYDLAPNGGGACGSSSPFDALAAADLAIDLVDTDGTTVLMSASGSAAGVAEALSIVPLDSAGTYYLRVRESDSPTSPQGYELEVWITACTVDSDGDGTADCNDGCPLDPLKLAPGVCGCGIVDVDSDGDGTFDCHDGCPLDPLKVAVGQCGCGVEDTDSDGDGTADCHDGCPLDPLKIAAGQCGCGVSDGDTDGDGTADCNDGCPLDPLKVAPGTCGCGVSDADSDGDGTPDCNDPCPLDPLKIDPGLCGCGVSDVDTDGDGTPNCFDLCPNDPDKIDPGICGCGVADVDSDGDGALDCEEMCPLDPLKLDPGICGCGVPDVDTDGDGALDCVELCPLDPLKVDPGVCGCGIPDVDTDGDGTLDCDDTCPTIPDPMQLDGDGDGIGDLCDNCPDHPNFEQADCDGDGQGDVCVIALGLEEDCDLDGLPDSCEPDCNLNGVIDGCDILFGTSLDTNLDGIPDECAAPCPAIQAYCTAKVNSLGCPPTIGWQGTPSVGQPSGFVISCTNAIPDRTGQLFYGYASSQAPFQGGHLCVKPPFRRTFVQLSTGTFPCNGTYTFDFNAWMATGNDPLLTPGINVFTRWWMRDPQASFTTGFSNALTFTVCP
jgi:hypothetical protein